jgi:hypothetical protein
MLALLPSVARTWAAASRMAAAVDLTAFCDKMESEEGWLKRKFRLWRTHPWMFVAGFAAGLAVYEAARLIFG